MRQGNDVGTQYRSAIFIHARRSRSRPPRRRATMYQARAGKARLRRDHDRDPPPAPEFYFAEDYHQQYLAKNPNGYCPNHATGVAARSGSAVTSTSGSPITLVG